MNVNISIKDEFPKYDDLAKDHRNDGFVKSRHSRAGGIQGIFKTLKRLDSRFHGNDGKKAFWTFYETINFWSYLLSP
jgi:hypothetical protein